MSEAEGGSCWQRGLDLLEWHEILGRVIGVRQCFALCDLIIRVVENGVKIIVILSNCRAWPQVLP